MEYDTPSCAFCEEPLDASGAGVARSHACEHSFHTQCLINRTYITYVSYIQHTCSCGALLWEPPAGSVHGPASVYGGGGGAGAAAGEVSAELQANPTFQEDLKKLKKKGAERNKAAAAARSILTREKRGWRAAIQDAVNTIKAAKKVAISSVQADPAYKEMRSKKASYERAIQTFQTRWNVKWWGLRHLLPECYRRYLSGISCHGRAFSLRI